MTALAPSTWVRVCGVEDVPLLEGRSTSVDGRRIAIFRLLDGLAAIDAHCPHAAGPLHDGIVADSCVTCPLHGRRFDLTSGQALNGPESVAVHEVEERDGEIWVRLTGAPTRTTHSGGPRPPLPGGGRHTRTTSMRAASAAGSDDR